MIYGDLQEGYRLKAIQIDPNGLCNAGCWFCPVGHVKNPKSAIADMPIDVFEDIVIQIKNAKGKFISPLLTTLYSAHYNEILLYKHFNEMLEVLRKHSFKIFVLSNGIALTKSKVDKIREYDDVVAGILLNVPAADEESWSKAVNMNKSLFKKVIENIRYAHDTLDTFVDNNRFDIQVNGIDILSKIENGGWVEVLENAPDINLDPETGDLHTAYLKLQELFPKAKVYKYNQIYDRAGKLAELGVITNRNAMSKYLETEGKKVIGCSGGIRYRSRTKEWIHINANGDVFLCCDDFDFVTVYGSLKERTLENLWFSNDRQVAIKNAQNSLCTNCSAAIWG